MSSVCVTALCTVTTPLSGLRSNSATVGLDEASARFYLAEIVETVHSLHCDGYIHHHITPKNVVVDRTGYVKLIGCTPDYIGCTPDYLSPEVLMQESPDGQRRVQLVVGWCLCVQDDVWTPSIQL